MSDLYFFKEVVKFVYYTTFVLIWYHSNQLHFNAGFKTNIISEFTWLYVDFVITFTFISNTRDKSLIYGSLKTAKNYSSP